MARVRAIVEPVQQGENVTVKKARSVFLGLRREAKAAMPVLRAAERRRAERAGILFARMAPDTVITADMVGHIVPVHIGRDKNQSTVRVRVRKEMVGRRLGDFALRSRAR